MQRVLAAVGETRAPTAVVTAPSARARSNLACFRSRMVGTAAATPAGTPFGSRRPSASSSCLAHLKDHRSLMPMAQEAKRRMFLLKPAAGAIGAHQLAVRDRYTDSGLVAAELLRRLVGAG